MFLVDRDVGEEVQLPSRGTGIQRKGDEAVSHRRDFLKSMLFAAGSATFLGACSEPKVVRASSGPEKEKDGSFSFAFITDAHLAPNLGSVREWELPAARESLVEAPLVGYRRVLDEIRSRPVDLVVTGGDDVELLTYERPPIKGYLPVTEDFDALEQCVRKMRAIEESTGLPFHYTMGNHQSFEYPPAAPDSPLYAEGWFIKYWGQGGRAYHSFDRGGWHFVVLCTHDRKETNSREWCGMSEEQIRWLGRDLERTGRRTPVIVVAHVPFDSKRIQGDFEKVGQVLKGYNVKLGLCGHEHGFREFTWNGIPCVVGSSLSGAVWSAVRNVCDTTYRHNSDQGYLLVTIADGQVTWRHYPFTYNIEKYYHEQTGKRPYGVSRRWLSSRENAADARKN